MALTTAARVLALAGSGTLALALQVPAHGTGATHTAISTPSNGATFLVQGGTPTMQVAGHVSSGVTAVDVYCLGGPQGSVTSIPVASNVSVTAGAFSTAAPVPNAGSSSPVCRLRALPHGTSVNADVSAFAGPIVHLDRVERLTQASSTFDFDLTAGSGAGTMEVHSAANCGDGALGSVPDDLGAPFAFDGCVADLGASALDDVPLRVDGHTALLPYSTLSLDSSTALQLRIHAARSGRVSWTESAPLVRCAGSQAFPPLAGPCGALVSTGVRFSRHGTFTASGQQIDLQDSFTSTDGAKHRVRTVYGMGWTPPSTGGLGFAFPGHRGRFRRSTNGQIVTGLPKRAGTVLVRSDRFAGEGDPMAATRAVTWSRPPTHLAFAPGDASVFGASYSLKVPRVGAVRLGFTDSETVRTSSAIELGEKAVAAVMPFPRITSPGTGVVVEGKKTVVKGIVRAGVNGLPVSVRVDGTEATLTATSATRATFKAVLDEPPGKHTLAATAEDAGGNKRTASITVRNK